MKTSTFIVFVLAVVLAGCGQQGHEANTAASVRTFSEPEVREFVTQGRTVAEITNRFGVPGATMTNDGRVVMWFSNPINASAAGPNTFAFSASFTNGIVEKWEPMRVHVQAAQ